MRCTRFIAVVVLLVSGCLMEAPAEEVAGRTERAVSSINRLSLNRLSLNRLSLNRLSLNRLSLNRLSLNRLSFNSVKSGGLEDSGDGREVLEYVARCALEDGDILVVTDSDGTSYDFPGLLGLVPDWEARALTTSEEHLISGCLVAHVNAYGVSVEVSMRVVNQLTADAQEKSYFAVYEGSFFGDVFVDETETVKTYSCQGDQANLALVHSESRSQRVCTDAGRDCGVISVGRCRDVCLEHDDRYGWRKCTVDLGRGVTEYYEETVSVFLHADDPDRANQECSAGGTCTFTSTANQAALHACSAATSCTTTCGDGGTCIVNGGKAMSVSATAEATSLVQVDCLAAGTCSATCADGASCEIDCKDAGTCTAIQCTSGSSCLLDCTGTAVGSCGFSQCTEGMTTCPGDILVCGRACP